MPRHQPGISRGALYGLLIVYVCMVAVVVTGLLYTNWVSRENNRQWCDVLISIDDAYKGVSNNPTATPAGKHIAEEFHRLREKFEC